MLSLPPLRLRFALAIAAAMMAFGTSASARGLEPATSKLVQRLMRDGEVPGLSIAVVTRGQIGPIAAFGTRNAAGGEPVEHRTVFEAASLSKPVVAYAALKLVDAGKLRLDAPIAGYADGGALTADPRWKRITVRMLLAHRSGLPNELRPGQAPGIDFEPGTRFSYSGMGYLFLQAAIEQATGQKLDAAVDRLVFQPLAMHDSSFVWRSAYEVQKAIGHDSSGRPTARRKPDSAKAPSSLHTTAADYARFLRAVLDRSGLSAKSWRAMSSGQFAVQSGCVNCFGEPAGPPHASIAWGLGWAVERGPAGDHLFHWGENNGDFHAFVMGNPRTRSGLVILTNSGNGLSIVPSIVTAVLPQPHPAFAWMGYEPYDSTSRLVQRRILQAGSEQVLAEAAVSGQPALTESQWNRIAYQLLGRGRQRDAVAVFAFIVRRFPNSANAYDSLGEAQLSVGDKAAALKYYRRSLELDPGNNNARRIIARLQQETR